MNVSGVQLVRPDYVTRLAEVLAGVGFRGPGLELEITESVLMRDAAQSLSVLHSLRELGLRLSIDDFGTGYSSLSYLKRLPVDMLKIDRSFVSGLGSDAEDAAIVGAVVALASSLGMITLAEGAENADAGRPGAAPGLHPGAGLPPGPAGAGRGARGPVRRGGGRGERRPHAARRPGGAHRMHLSRHRGSRCRGSRHRGSRCRLRIGAGSEPVPLSVGALSVGGRPPPRAPRPAPAAAAPARCR